MLVHLNACIMVGGIVRFALDKLKRNEEEKTAIVNDGILFCSGMIAGEGLVGIALALFAIMGMHSIALIINVEIRMSLKNR